MFRINLWSSPRNISTALMYAFAQHPDFEVVDEPLYAHYLTVHPEQMDRHPAANAVINAQHTNGTKVLRDLWSRDTNGKHLLAKQMTHHLPGISLQEIVPFTNILLIRPPERIIFSYQKVIQAPTMQDIGIQAQQELFEFLSTENNAVYVLDTHELLKSPKTVFTKLFDRLGIAWSPKMLSWEKGPKKEDGVWAQHWYANAHNSTGFMPFQEKKVELPKALNPLLEACTPIYKSLFEHAIKA